MRSSARIAMAFLVTGVITSAPGPAAGETIFPFTAVLNGAQENPPRDSPSQGVAQVLLIKETDMVCYRISFSPLAGAEILAHFHGPASPSQNADILVDISPSPTPLGSPKHDCVQFTKDQVKLLKNGLIYINIHSSTFTGGEIRGQVFPVKGVKYNKVPAPTSPSSAFLD